jgi:DNA polymerase-1
MKKIWVLIDGNNQACKDYFGGGISKIADRTKARLDHLKAKWRPERIACCWDIGRSFRHDMHSEYKGKREKDERLPMALELAKMSVMMSGTESWGCDGYEADDIIASLTRDGLDAGSQVIVLSSDKDLYQLITPDKVVQMTSIKRNAGDVEYDWMNWKQLYEKYGVTHEQWVDYRVLTGDSSDNIAGVRGVGPKAAQSILRDCGSIERFYADPSVAGVGDAIKRKMLDAKEQIPWLSDLISLRSGISKELKVV